MYIYMYNLTLTINYSSNKSHLHCINTCYRILIRSNTYHLILVLRLAGFGWSEVNYIPRKSALIRLYINR
ncbi:hypothetical protein KUTeg_003394 [Tegillarca granosa]|uniref:Uncharacterized protein n=1 Tax=Tegillarca granosa TaxID=220873 RepID=A0ABQ9FM24_TEGGR|nr:hypothetical protein KUTeg_003394 [Tegillarca granosa]